MLQGRNMLAPCCAALDSQPWTVAKWAIYRNKMLRTLCTCFFCRECPPPPLPPQGVSAPERGFPECFWAACTHSLASSHLQSFLLFYFLFPFIVTYRYLVYSFVGRLLSALSPPSPTILAPWRLWSNWSCLLLYLQYLEWCLTHSTDLKGISSS